jgi:hypothetical protein
MAKKVATISMSDIRNFTNRNGGIVKDWLPSIDGDFQNTFTLAGTNKDLKSSSKGEINILTDFGNPQNINKTTDLNRFYLILYCLQNNPYFFSNINDVLSYNKDDILFTNALETFFTGYQTGKNNNIYSKSLTADVVRTYRKGKTTSAASEEQKDIDANIQKLINFAGSSNDYLVNVAGVLGKVTYDSVVKQTLHFLLKNNGLINNYKGRDGKSWSDEASKLTEDQIDYYIDESGGPYSRAFPVVCVYTKAKSELKINDILEKSNKFVSSKFFREVTGNNGLVTPLNVGNEKNFIEIHNQKDSGYSVYCILYDFTKIIVLNANTQNDYTLDLLKLGLSFLSRKRIDTFKNVDELQQQISKIKDFLNASYGEELEENNYSINYINKHTDECAYSLQKQSSSIKPKISNTFKAQLKLVLKSLEDSYDQIIFLFNKEVRPGENQNFQFNNYPIDKDAPIILHFDNFYNLLAITSVKKSEKTQTKEYPANVPFDLSQYEVKFGSTDLLKRFFKDSDLPEFPENSSNPDYKFTKEIALSQDIVCITDVFLRQLYENLDSQSKGLVYENDQNQDKDAVLYFPSINLLNLIEERTTTDNQPGIVLKKSDYFFEVSNKVNLRKEIVKKLELETLFFLFDSVKEDKIKFQTINHLINVNLEKLKKKKLTDNDFENVLYYPKIKQISTAPKDKKEPKEPATPPVPKTIPKNNNYLINNIISSELACYEDIANSFDKAINADKNEDKLYYAFQTIANIGLPILLTYSAQKIASRISQLSKNKIDPSLLDCILADSDSLKKFILGYSDLLSRDNITSLLGQAVPELPKIPAIVFLTTFDAEKELKRRLFKYVVDIILESLKEQLKLALTSLIDMCNSDSYLTAFLSSALPNNNQSTGKIGAPTAAGMPAGDISTIYDPEILININNLIDKTGVATRESVYELFRLSFIAPEDSNKYSNDSISSFFDYISEIIDAGQMVSLLKGSSQPQTRSTILSYIKNYQKNSNDKTPDFSILFDDLQSVGYLFLFLGQFIDYKLCLEIISNSLLNFIPSVCVDINSKFNDNSSSFSEEEMNDQVSDLEKTLDEICKTKQPLTADIFAAGPPLLTKKLAGALNSAYESTINSIPLSFKSIITGESNDSKKELASVKTTFVYSDIFKYPEFIKILDDKLVEYYDVGNVLNIQAGYKDVDIFKDFVKINNENYNVKDTKELFKNDLQSIGNIGLKTQEETFSGYIEKLNAVSDPAKLKGINILNILEINNM